MNVIIADDQPLFRDGIAEILRQLDADVVLTILSDGRGLLDAAGADISFDLVLLAANFLREDGAPELAQLRGRFPGVPIVLVSPACSQREAESYIESGASGVILRQDSPQLIRSALRLALDGGVFMPASPPAGPRGPVTAVSYDFPAGDHNGGGELAEAEIKSLLTRRQAAVLALIGRGWTNRRIADELGVSEGTVKVHVNAVLRALKVRNRTEAALHVGRMAGRIRKVAGD